MRLSPVTVNGADRAPKLWRSLAPRSGERDAGRDRPLFLLVSLLQRGAENIAERRAAIGRAVLGDRLLLLGDLQRLDRNADLARLLVELRHAGIDLLADRETLGPLLGAVAREFGALDEGGELGADDLHVDAAFLHLGHLGGDHRVALQVARLGERIGLE